jgi:hypothetical protein
MRVYARTFCVSLALALGIAGCSHAPVSETDPSGAFPVGVPPNARIVRAGRGNAVGLLDLTSVDREMTFKAQNDGTVWVIERSNGRTLYKGTVRQNDKLTVNTKRHFIAINDGYVYEAGMMEDEQFLVYFAPTPPATGPATKPSS